MTLRTRSRAQQVLVGLVAALVVAVLYVVLSFALYGSVSLNVLDPLRYRLALPLVILFGLIAWETRVLGAGCLVLGAESGKEGKRESGKEGKRERGKEGKLKGKVENGKWKVGKRESEAPRPVGGDHRAPRPHPAPTTPHPAPTTPHPAPSTPHPAPSTKHPAPTTPIPSGEAEYATARMMRHQSIPDWRIDREYLGLLVKSADLGYVRAMAKLGEYALRRGWMVEAYYWFWRAKKGGVHNLDRTMAQVRSAWAKGGFRRESANVYPFFSRTQGTMGYALLCIDTRHNAGVARARLAACAPEWLG